LSCIIFVFPVPFSGEYLGEYIDEHVAEQRGFLKSQASQYLFTPEGPLSLLFLSLGNKYAA